ncbi:MAG: aldolase/citrate lyase family protein [Parazoarcus communis]
MHAIRNANCPIGHHSFAQGQDIMTSRYIAAAALSSALSLLCGNPALALDSDQGRKISPNIDPKSWVYGPRFNDTTGGVIWNPVKQKLLNGERFAGRTVQGTYPATSDSTYCNAASNPMPNPTSDMSDPDFTWTEMQHSGLTWGDAWRMWAHGSSDACPARKAIPGVRVAYTNEHEIQHALDGGAMVLVVPTVDTEEEAREVVQWAYFPPFGRRSAGGSQTNAVLTPWLAAKGLTNAQYRQTFNNNLVLIVMIETIEGVKNAAKIARVPGVHAVFAASGDLGNFSGWAQGDAQYERLIKAVKDAAVESGKRVCGPYAWRLNPDVNGVPRTSFSCFQN